MGSARNNDRLMQRFLVFVYRGARFPLIRRLPGFWKVRSLFLWLLTEKLGGIVFKNVTVHLLCGETVRLDSRYPRWHQFIAKGTHEIDVERFLVQCLMPGDVVVDVGAATGKLTLIAAKRVGPAGKVYSFEADETSIRYLHRAIELNALQHVRVENVALGDEDGEARFWKPETAYGVFQVPGGGTVANGGLSPAENSRLAIDRFYPGVPRTELVCSLMRFDTYAKVHGIEHVDLVKIDVDGPDLLVLRGMESFLTSPRPPLIVVESSPYNLDFGTPFEQMFSYLTNLGYEVWATRRKQDDFVRVTAPEDLPVNINSEVDAANVFCHIPRAHQARWERLGLAATVRTP